MAAVLDSSYFDFVYFIILVISVGAGYIFARYRYFSKQRAWKVSGVENAIIGFYGLLLSFTLVQSGVSNKDRISLVHQEADALATIHRESFFLPDSSNAIIRKQLVHILELNVKAGNADHGNRLAISEEINDAYDSTWRLIKDISRDEKTHRDILTVIQGELNRAIELNYKMQYTHHERTPVRIMVLLILGSWLVGILVGFTNGFNEEHHFLVPIIFIMLTGLTLLAIRDLDDPISGVIRPSYENFAELLNEIRQH